MIQETALTYPARIVETLPDYTEVVLAPLGKTALLNLIPGHFVPGGMTLVIDAQAADYPAEADVRSGVVYDNGDKIGTLAVTGGSGGGNSCF